MYYTPLDLQKLCCNIIIKSIYHEKEEFFLSNLKEINLLTELNDLIIDRYKVIKLILNN